MSQNVAARLKELRELRRDVHKDVRELSEELEAVEAAIKQLYPFDAAKSDTTGRNAEIKLVLANLDEHRDLIAKKLEDRQQLVDQIARYRDLKCRVDGLKDMQAEYDDLIKGIKFSQNEKMIRATQLFAETVQRLAGLTGEEELVRVEVVKAADVDERPLRQTTPPSSRPSRRPVTDEEVANPFA